MKFNPITSIIAIGISALIAYAFYNYSNGPQNLYLCGGSFIFLSLTLLFTIGIRFNYYRAGINTRMVSIFFSGIALVTNLVFSFLKFSGPDYIITHGILLLIYILLLYYANRATSAV